MRPKVRTPQRLHGRVVRNVVPEFENVASDRTWRRLFSVLTREFDFS
jgi:hypothetical protein